ncbi:MAG: phosphatidate cytidylyltransferase [Phycisphaerae bacterium]
MVQRILFGTLAIAALLSIVLVDVIISEFAGRQDGALWELLQHGSAIPVAAAVATAIGCAELHRLLAATGAAPARGLGQVITALLILSPWLSAGGVLGTDPAAVKGLYWQIIWLVAGVLGAAALLVRRGGTNGALRDFGATLLPMIYLGFLASFAIQLRCGRDLPGHTGAWLLVIVLLVIKASDIGAYLVGSTLGRRPLARTISPGKTVEGLCGGTVASVVVSVLFASLYLVSPHDLKLPAFAAETVKEIGAVFLPTDQSNWAWRAVQAGIFGAILSLFAPIGDLLESCFKRDAAYKDSGALIPTFGGILDLIDSPLVAVPVAWVLLSVVWGVG